MLTEQEARDLSIIMAIFSKEDDDRMEAEIEEMYQDYLQRQAKGQ